MEARVCSQRLDFRKNEIAKFRSQGAAIYNIYLAIQQFLQTLKQPDMVGQSVALLEINQQIDIAVSVRIPARHRTEYRNLKHAMPSRQRQDLLAPLPQIFQVSDRFAVHMHRSRLGTHTLIIADNRQT